MGHADREHAPLGGSSAERWVNCPGSVFYLRDLPPDEGNAATDQGTRAHELAEKVLRSFLQHKIEGTPVEEPSTDDPEMDEHVMDYVRAVWKEALEESITGKAYELEDRLTIDQHLQMWGSSDFWAVYIDDRAKRVGIIGDFKYGYHFVSEEDNGQLAFYAVALRSEIRRAGKDLDYVRAFIFQPRAGDDGAQGKPSYREYKFTAAKLDSWEKKFLKAAEQIFVKQVPKFKAGDWCQWCRAKAQCKTHAREIETKTALQVIDPEMNTLPLPEKLTDEQLLRIVIHGDTLTDFVAACKTFALARAKAGKPIPGTKIVQASAGRRKWREEIQEVGDALQQHGIENPFDFSLKGISEMEKALTKLHGKENAKNLMNTLCVQGKPGVKLVPEDDERPAVASLVDLLTE